MGLEDQSIEFRLQVLGDDDGYVGNLGDYVDAAGYEALLQNLAENDSSGRIGAPPASKLAIEGLQTVEVKLNNMEIYAICKDRGFNNEGKITQEPYLISHNSNTQFFYLSTAPPSPSTMDEQADLVQQLKPKVSYLIFNGASMDFEMNRGSWAQWISGAQTSGFTIDTPSSQVITTAQTLFLPPSLSLSLSLSFTPSLSSTPPYLSIKSVRSIEGFDGFIGWTRVT